MIKMIAFSLILLAGCATKKQPDLAHEVNVKLTQENQELKSQNDRLRRENESFRKVFRKQLELTGEVEREEYGK